MLHFAYGSNMDRAVMRKHAPAAEPLGIATLTHYRFIITADGYASVEPARASIVHGVLWRLTPRDRVTLDAWESIACGRYHAEILAVQQGSRRRQALVYIARPQRTGRAKAGYMELITAAARGWNLPPGYVAELQHWLPARPGAAGARNLREFGWT